MEGEIIIALISLGSGFSLAYFTPRFKINAEEKREKRKQEKEIKEKVDEFNYIIAELRKHVVLFVYEEADFMQLIRTIAKKQEYSVFDFTEYLETFKIPAEVAFTVKLDFDEKEGLNERGVVYQIFYVASYYGLYDLKEELGGPPISATPTKKLRELLRYMDEEKIPRFGDL